MPKVLVNNSYASMQAYEFDGTKKVDEVQLYLYHQVRDFRRGGDATSCTDVPALFDDLTHELSDKYGNGWRNNLELVILWSPEFSDVEKSEYKQQLMASGVENFDFYDPCALSDYLLQRDGKFNNTCRYAVNLWANGSHVYIRLYHYTDEGEYKFIGQTVAEQAAEDPRVPYLTNMMLAELRPLVEGVDREIDTIREVATKFIQSGKAVSNEIVTLSSGFQRTFLLTDQYQEDTTNCSDILNKSLSVLLSENHLNEKDCQVVLSAGFATKQNLLEVVRHMFTYICDESSDHEDALLQAAFKQMEYTLKTAGSLQQRIAFCGDGPVIDRPVMMVWTCPKCHRSIECIEAPKECPHCHGNEIPDNLGGLTIDAEMHVTKTGGFLFRKKSYQLEITVTPVEGGIGAKLLLIVGKKPIGVYNSNIAIGRWVHEFPQGVHDQLSIVVTQDDYPELAQADELYIDIKPHYTYQDVNAFVVATKKMKKVE